MASFNNSKLWTSRAMEAEPPSHEGSRRVGWYDKLDEESPMTWFQKEAFNYVEIGPEGKTGKPVAQLLAMGKPIYPLTFHNMLENVID